jgi:hypothetical protein
MDQQKELEQERARRITLEKELEFWLKGAIENLTPEQLAQAVQSQQVETLTYHLLKSRQQVDELKAQLSARVSELANAVENIKRLERDLDGKSKAQEKLSQDIGSLKRQVEDLQKEEEMAAMSAKVQFAPTQAPGSIVQVEAQHAIPLLPKSDKPKTIKDMIQLMSRIQRVKLLDAAILLEVKPETVSVWAEDLAARGYLEIQGAAEKKTLTATDKLLRGK